MRPHYVLKACPLQENKPERHDEYRLLRDVAEEAGRLAMQYFRDKRLKVWNKTPDHPVSEADLAVNELIHKRLMQARPDYGWLSEESIRDDQTRQAERVWITDPIDGTRAFMRGDTDWCIGLALIEAGQVICSVVHAPARDELFRASLGDGAYLNDRSLQVSRCTAEAGCRMIASEAMLSHPAWREPWPDMILARPKPNATLLRLCLVASGQWDATLALSRKSDWDIAPASLIVAEAGGLATTHLGEPFLFNRNEPAQRSLLASGKALHSLLTARIAEVRLPDPDQAAIKASDKRMRSR